MTLLKIAQIGHPVLRLPAPPADPARLLALRPLVEDMVATMLDAQGIGLAAPQVYRSERIIVVLPMNGRDEEPEAPLVLINPVLTPVGDEQEAALEGCLSIPQLRGIVARWRRVAWRGLAPAGEAISGDAEGLFARILQHEVDHLDGVLFLDRLDVRRDLAVETEAHHLLHERSAPR